MKAPSADYSSLSQALSAKNSAIQTSYSAKDASNWKSSYDIQQKSFQLSRDSLNLQKEQTNVSGALNMVSAVTNLVDKSASLYSAIASAKQDDITQTLTQSSTAMANEWQTQLQMNSDYVTDIVDPVTGGATIGLTEKGQKAYDALMEKYFPSDTKYGWGMDDTATQLKESLRVSCLTYAQSQGLQNIQANADKIFTYNYEDALETDLVSGGTETVEVSDGAGGIKKLELGKQSKAVVDARPYATDDWKTAMYEKAAQDLTNKRETAIISNISEGYADGTYINDAQARTALDATITAHLETITDPTERKATEDSFKSTKDTAIQTYYTNQINAIKAQDKDVYKSLAHLYATVSEDGKDASGESFTNRSLFYDEDGKPAKYVSESTLNAVRSAISAEMSTIEASAGTMQTNNINNTLTSLNTRLKAGEISPEGWVAAFTSAMQEEYGDYWQTSTEARNIYSKNVLALLPSDLSSDPAFKSAWNTSVSLMFSMDSSQLNDSQKGYAEIAKLSMMNELTQLVVQDPTIALDPTKYISTLQDIASRYNAEWLDIIDDSFQADYFQTVGGKEAEAIFKDEMKKIVKNYSSEISSNLSETGWWDRTNNNLPEGIDTKTTEFLVGLAENGEKADYIADPRSGQIQFAKDKNGNLTVSQVVWKGIDTDTMKNVQVIYNAQTGEWKYTGTISQKPTQAASVPSSAIKSGDETMAEPPIDIGSAGEITAWTINNVESGNVYKASSDVADEAVSTVNDDIDTFLTNGINSATEGGLETFLWDMATTEARLDETAEKLKEKHAEGEYAPGMSETEFDSQMTTVLNRVKQNKGWTKSTTAAEPKETKAESEEDQKSPVEVIDSKAFRDAQTYTREHPKSDPASVYQYLKGIETQAEFEDAVQGLRYEAENSNFLLEKVDDPDAVINGYADDIRKKKGWAESSTTATEAKADTATATAETKKEEVKTESATTAEQKELTANSKGTQAANDFLKKNKSTSQMQLLAALFQWKDAGKLDGTYEVLKNAIANGNLIIETGSPLMASKSDNPYEILDDIYEQVKKGRK